MHHEFESIHALADWLDQTPALEGAGDSSSAERGTEWAEWSYTDTLQRLRVGGAYPEALARMPTVDIDAASFARADGPVWQPTHVASGGQSFDIAAYLDNDPEWILDTRCELSARKLVRIAFNICASASIEAAHITARTAGLLAFVDHMERVGYSCEVHALYSANSRTDGSTFTLSVPIKRAGGHWAPEQLAFACSAAFMRRLGFAWAERTDLGISTGGYGLVNRGRPDYLDPDVLFLPGMHADDWTDPKLVVQNLREQFEAS